VTAAPFSSWLYRIANNEASYYFRKKKYEPASYDAAREDGGFPEPASREDVEQEFMQAQQAADNNRDYRELKEMIVKMPVKYQEAITLRFMEEKKINEIAEILGKSEGTVKSLLSRGLERLRKQFLSGKTQLSGAPGIITREETAKKGGI
jgi:RNA polymerase sigma-70 factor (ECF subfamily)